MKRLIALFVLLFSVVTAANAAQFETVVDALAIPEKESHTNNNWSATQRIKGVRWKWPFHQTGEHNSTQVGVAKVGKNKNPNVGAVTVTVTGARSFISKIHLSIANPEETLTVADFGKGKATMLKTTCDEPSVSNTVEFYRFVKPGFKPLFIGHQASYGASGAGTDNWELSNSLNEALDMDIQAEPCKLSPQ